MSARGYGRTGRAPARAKSRAWRRAIGGRVGRARVLSIVLALLAPSSSHGQDVCSDEFDACLAPCSQLTDLALLNRCVCQCYFSQCECVFGGIGYADECVQAMNQSCGGDPTGLTQQTPVLPDASFEGGFVFDNAISGMWVDPPATDTFVFEMSDTSLFTAIVDFPTGFSQPFVVSVDGQEVGTFGPGQSVDFSGHPGGGVSSFDVSGIAPEVDSADPEAFPIRLGYDTATAAFTMRVPEPGSFVGGLAAVASVAWLRRRGCQ